MSSQTLFDKIWDRHVVVAGEDGQTLLYIDRHLCHDGSIQGFKRLRQQGRQPKTDCQRCPRLLKHHRQA